MDGQHKSGCNAVRMGKGTEANGTRQGGGMVLNIRTEMAESSPSQSHRQNVDWRNRIATLRAAAGDARGDTIMEILRGRG